MQWPRRLTGDGNLLPAAHAAGWVRSAGADPTRRGFPPGAGLGGRDTTAVQVDAAEVVLWAERRLGELLGQTVQHGGDRKTENKVTACHLDDLGISKKQSSRWQRVFGLPHELFTDYLKRARNHQKPATQAGLLRIARDLRLQHTEGVAAIQTCVVAVVALLVLRLQNPVATPRGQYATWRASADPVGHGGV